VPNQTAHAYDAQATVTPDRFGRIMADYLEQSARATADLPGHTDVVYDRPSGQLLDVWGVGDTPRPTFFVVHGGYWRALSRQHTAFMAALLAERGIATVAIDYGLAPATTLPEIVRQVRAAYAFVRLRGHDLGINTERVVVGGSSAGAHLAAMTMVGGRWAHDAGLDGRTATEGLLISGLYDLRPLVDAPANAWLHLTEDAASEVSPALAPPPSRDSTVVVARAANEAAGFSAQSDDLHSRWSPSLTCRSMTVPDRDHFDVFLDLADPTSSLSASLAALIESTDVRTES